MLGAQGFDLWQCARCAEGLVQLAVELWPYLVGRVQQVWGAWKMTDDDDIQDYARPWKGLTEEERKEIWNVGEKKDQTLRALLIQTIRDVEAKLKERNTW